jgi:hypothetical protein
MSLADGALLFIACVLSFVIGYVVGVIRVGRYVNTRLDEIKGSVLEIRKAGEQLKQIYAKLGENDKQPSP